MLRPFNILFGLLSLLALNSLVMGSTLPLVPKDYVLDGAGVLEATRSKALSQKLRAFEAETSNQIVVAVIPRVPEDYVMEDFTQRTAEAWGVGKKGKDNGVVLFVFPESRMVRIEVGYGLEGAIPDALANRIIQSDILPYFRKGDYIGGVERGVNSLMKASKGEYQADSKFEFRDMMGIWILVVFAMVYLGQAVYSEFSFGYGLYKRSGKIFGRRGFFGSRRGLGGSRRGGSGSSRGFRGGGGSFGGGGSSGRW